MWDLLSLAFFYLYRRSSRFDYYLSTINNISHTTHTRLCDWFLSFFVAVVCVLFTQTLISWKDRFTNDDKNDGDDEEECDNVERELKKCDQRRATKHSQTLTTNEKKKLMFTDTRVEKWTQKLGSIHAKVNVSYWNSLWNECAVFLKISKYSDIIGYEFSYFYLLERKKQV